MVVVMNSNGEAIIADNDDAETDAPSLLFVAFDGDVDNDGALVHKLTCCQGGCRLKDDQYVAAGYTPGDVLTCGNAADEGKFRAAAAGEQIYGVVGPDGLDSTNGVLDVIIPQGIAPAV
jgi:hypothetical protein